MKKKGFYIETVGYTYDDITDYKWKTAPHGKYFKFPPVWKDKERDSVKVRIIIEEVRRLR